MDERLRAVPLEEAAPDLLRQLHKMLREQVEQEDLHQKGHRCWLFIPTPKEYRAMKKYARNDTCPKCKKGRIVLEVFKGNFGDNLWLKCYWGKECDFAECVSDLDDI